MTRQAGKLSGLGTYQGVWYRHASTVAAGGPLFWSNTIVVAYEKMIRSARACSLCHAKNRPHDQCLVQLNRTFYLSLFDGNSIFVSSNSVFVFVTFR